MSQNSSFSTCCLMKLTIRVNNVSVFEIHPTSSNPSFHKVASLDIAIRAWRDRYCLCGDRLFIVSGGVVTVWDFSQDLWANWEIGKQPSYVSQCLISTLILIANRFPQQIIMSFLLKMMINRGWDSGGSLHYVRSAARRHLSGCSLLTSGSHCPATFQSDTTVVWMTGI